MERPFSKVTNQTFSLSASGGKPQQTSMELPKWGQLVSISLMDMQVKLTALPESQPLNNERNF